MSTELRTSKRFERPIERRDFLGLTAIWSAVVAWGVALLGAMRLPMPSVFPESNSRLKLGPLEKYRTVTMVAMPEQRLWVYRDAEGLYALSAVCTHLGCVVAVDEGKGYFCPCHGSRFDTQGKVVAGPAPRPLVYLDLFVSPDGHLVVDRQKEVSSEARLKA